MAEEAPVIFWLFVAVGIACFGYLLGLWTKYMFSRDDIFESEDDIDVGDGVFVPAGSSVRYETTKHPTINHEHVSLDEA